MISFNGFREERVKSKSNEHNVDALILSQPENIDYYSGFFPMGMVILPPVESYLVLNPANGRMGLVTSAADVPTILETGYNQAIYPLGSFNFYIPETDEFSSSVKSILSKRFGQTDEGLFAALSDIAPDAKIIAVDEPRMPVSTWTALKLKLDKAELISGTKLINEIKSVKHPLEIKLLQEAANIAEECLFSVISEIRYDMSEYDIEMNYRQKVTAKECDPYFFIATIDKRAAFSDTENKDFSKIKEGSIIRFDFGCIHKGYRSDMSRTVVVGSNKKAEAYYAAIREGEERAIEAMKPGVTAGEIFDIAVNTTRNAGIPHYQRHHVGHGIGRAIYDAPSITPGNKTILEENMVFCVETPYYEIGWGGVQVEDPVWVTSNGAEYLSKTPRDLVKITI